MFNKFNAAEILEMAEQIERNGQEFYRKAADQAQDSDTKGFLLELAEMEVEHEKTFAALKDQLSAQEQQDAVFDPNDENVLYLQALADSRVFFEKKIDVSSAEEVFKEAIQAEKDSIVFYLGMKEMVPASMGVNKIESIIKEEMGHIKIIANKLTSLKA